MIPKKVEDAFNKQINAELYSSYLYFAMEAYFNSVNLSGFANWMHIQAMEELAHATKMFNFVDERGGRVILEGIEKPASEWESPLAAFEAAYSHEQKVTGLINDLVDLSASEKDHASVNFLQWFVDEQVEEEASADAIVQQLKLAEGAAGAMFMLDREMGARTFTPPAAEGE